MARTIESPGVEINEIDLSLNASLPVGTNIFVQGFALQGPTDELLNITSITEFEQIYGMPTNAAERYFYHTAKQVLNSPGNLLCTRLPYGLSAGGGFGSQYTALLYPVSGFIPVTTTNVTSAAIAVTNEIIDSGDDISTAFSGTLTNFPVSADTLSIEVSGYELTSESGILTGSNAIALAAQMSGTITEATGAWTLNTQSIILSSTDVITTDYYYVSTTSSSTTTNTATSYEDATLYEIGAPNLIELTESQYNAWQAQNGPLWATSTGAASSYDTAGNAGFIVLNEQKVNINNFFEGYYIGIQDNQIFDRQDSAGNDIFDSVKAVNYFDTNKDKQEVSTSILGFNLTGTSVGDSASEDLDSIVDFEFENSQYNDSVMVGLFKIRKATTTEISDKSLDYVLIERNYGSFDADRTRDDGFSNRSAFIKDELQDNSYFTNVFVNRNISEAGSWAGPDATTPAKTVRVSDEANKLFAIGPYENKKCSDAGKIGNLPLKLERSMRLAENRDQIPIDIVCDGGLSTIWPAVASPTDSEARLNDNDAGSYDDREYLPGVFERADAGNTKYLADQSTGAQSDVQDNWQVIYNIFEQFCSQTRKDCLFIMDPLRHIFVQGEDFRTLDDKEKSFSQHIQWPMKNLFGAANSNYACTYANWVKVFDAQRGGFIWVPFSGYMANIMANVDSNLQPWYAAAGLNNGLINNISDHALNPTQKQRDLLYRVSINPTVYFPGDGYVVWGQKTLQKKPSAFDRINVRRLFLTLEKATLNIMKYFVFEPNTVFTRTRVTNVLAPIFEIAKNNEGVYDYLIVCDERNNTPDVIDRNELVVDIYLKPVRTAEFILVNFIATRTDQDFNELI